MGKSYARAIARERYQRSSNKAMISDLLGLVTGANTGLVNFGEVAKRVKARQQVERGTEWVPLDLIVGSVGRYRDFTRAFLPRSSADPERWAQIDAALNTMETLPPVELFKIGDVYFVRDGNHRVSVARANRLSHIEAYVTELPTRVPLTLDDFKRDQWIIKAEYADFLEKTLLDDLRPGHDLVLTAPGRYETILHHIEVHRYFRDLELERAGSRKRLTWEEAVTSWYDNVYLPVVEAIRRYKVLKHFPGRTEADLYLWVTEHREVLARRYHLAPLSPDAAVHTFMQTQSGKPLERTFLGLRQGLHRMMGEDDVPLGLSPEELREGRLRHDAGELSVAEALEQLTQIDASEAIHGRQADARTERDKVESES